MPTCLNAGISGVSFSANCPNTFIADSRTVLSSSSIFLNDVKIGRVDVPIASARLLAFSDSAPLSATIPSAISVISSLVYFALGGIISPRDMDFSVMLVA